MKKLKHATHHGIRFARSEIWQMDIEDLPRSKALAVKGLRILLSAVHGYIHDRCALRASALTFYSLLTIVPVMALVLGIAKGFGFEEHLEAQLYMRLAGQEEVLKRIIDFALTLLDNTQGGLIAGIGVVVLFWSATKLLGHIEEALNEIWKVKPRSFIRRFTDYLAVMLVSPLLVILSSSITVFITTQVEAITGRLSLLQLASPVIYFLLRLLPYGLVWLLFILIYLVMPNTRVHYKSALLAGLVAGTIYQLSQGLFINTQIVVSRYNAIYGSFAALPLFLVWLQLSWSLVLIGAQVAYAHQAAGNSALPPLPNDRTISMRIRAQWALRTMREIVARFERGADAPTADELSRDLKLPLPQVEDILENLTDGRLVSKVKSERRRHLAYQPARAIQAISIADVLEALETHGENPGNPARDPSSDPEEALITRLQKERRQSGNNRLVKDL